MKKKKNEKGKEDVVCVKRNKQKKGSAFTRVLMRGRNAVLGKEKRNMFIPPPYAKRWLYN